MDLNVKNSKVFIGDSEVKGIKRYIILGLTYLLVPFIVAFALLIALLAVGLTISLVIPLVVVAFIMAGIAIVIKKLKG